MKGKYLEVGGENKNKTAFYFYLHFLKSEVGRMRELKIKVDEALLKQRRHDQGALVQHVNATFWSK